MSFDLQKQRLVENINWLIDNDVIDEKFITHNDLYIKELKQLSKDISEDKYVVVVIGEFKRGKSTFINSLIGKNLLPADVLPETATINILEYSDKAYVEVYTKDNKIYNGQCNREFLKNFSANNKEIVENTKFIKIGVNSEVLKGNFVLVDTPGVDDINLQRCDVTYSFMPNANAVIFLLDANSPLKATEKEFIETRIQPLGLQNLIFILNKYDCVDEDEDDGLLEDVECRLGNYLEYLKNDIRLFPLSAKIALKGKLETNTKLVEISGLPEVEKAFRNLALNGSVEEEKLARFSARLRDIIHRIYDEYDNELTLKNQSLDDLKEIKKHISIALKRQSEDKARIGVFVDDEISNICLMVDKSLNYFHDNILDNILENVRLYKGVDFKDYVEERVTKMLQREMENWVANYSVYVDQLLRTVEKEIAYGISCKFGQNVNIRSQFYMTNKTIFEFDLSSEDVSKARLNAGVIAAGGAGLLMLIGAPILMPFISMAAFPFLQEKIINEKLQKAKSKILPAIEEQIAEYINIVKDNMHSYIKEQCSVIAKNGEEVYDNCLMELQIRVDDEIYQKEKIGDEINRDVSTIKLHMDRLQKVIKVSMERSNIND